MSVTLVNKMRLGCILKTSYNGYFKIDVETNQVIVYSYDDKKYSRHMCRIEDLINLEDDFFNFDKLIIPNSIRSDYDKKV